MKTLLAWPRAYSGVVGRARLRAAAEDFIVRERLGFEPEGHGEHLWVRLEKIGENTLYVVKQLARHCGVAARDIGYAGLKDRRARVTQWFSIWLPGRPDPDWSNFDCATWRVVEARRHRRKLQRGALQGNDFEIILRAWSGDDEQLSQRLATIAAHGFPNYFGEQRFGRQQANLERAMELFQGRRVPREQRGIYLSAARAWLFNHVLARRVDLDIWQRAIAGDVLMFDNSGAFFHCPHADGATLERIAHGVLHPTGPLWGRGEPVVSNDALRLEQEVIRDFPALAQGLEHYGTEMARRALRARADYLHCTRHGENITLAFSLPAGAYATALLHEIVDYSEDGED